MAVYNGQVIKGVGGIYTVRLDDGRAVSVSGRGKLRRLGDIYIGDNVKVQLFNNGRGAIEEIYERKNKLIRPYISNIDAIVICIAPIPKPDFILVDKLLINCLSEQIEPIIAVNKSDIADTAFLEFVRRNYSGLADVVEVSALTGDVDGLAQLIKGKFICFTGQSAVGKSSLINRIIGLTLPVGELSVKSERGKHCTRHVEIFDYGDFKLADTCGFSSLTMENIDPDTLSEYFSDFDEYADKCRFRGCNHIAEPGCAVIRAVEEGMLAKGRYERYLSLYKECKEQWKERF